MNLVLDPLAPQGIRVADPPQFTAVGSTSSGGSTPASVVYEFQDYEKTGTYVYVGYKASNEAWYIYRRTISTNARLYAEGASDYLTNWTNQGSLSYA